MQTQKERKNAYSNYLVFDLNPSVEVCYAAFSDSTHKYSRFSICSGKHGTTF